MPAASKGLCGGPSRREMLGAAAAATAGIANPAKATLADENPARPSDNALPITLRVNGVDHELRIKPCTTLAEVLRGPLGLTGTKIACNRGSCSACTVWLDGEPICSCMFLAAEVGPRKVTTIEGLSDGDRLHPVQQAFVEHDAMQCGFCTPGMEMSCAALLQRNPDPSADDVARAISGHICRCGTYPHVVEATLAAAKSGKA